MENNFLSHPEEVNVWFDIVYLTAIGSDRKMEISTHRCTFRTIFSCAFAILIRKLVLHNVQLPELKKKHFQASTFPTKCFIN